MALESLWDYGYGICSIFINSADIVDLYIHTSIQFIVIYIHFFCTSTKN